jgi:acetyl esterase/lipase
MRLLENLSYGPHERNVVDLYLPDSPGRQGDKGAGTAPPLVLCIHGGGWCSGDKGMYDWVARKLTDCGLAAASINYRLAPDWVFPAALDDTQRAVRWLRRQASEYGYDAGRIAAIGSSAGGHLAAFLGLIETREHVADELAAYSSRVNCVVDNYGPVDMLGMMGSASAPIIEKFLGCRLNALTAEKYLAASPLAMVNATACPFLILHGSLDVGHTRGQVPVEISQCLAERLKAVGAEVEIRIYEGADHGYSVHPENPFAQRMFDDSLKFFRRYFD